MRSALAVLLPAGALLACLIGDAAAGPAATKVSDQSSKTPLSIGSPTDGRLEGGVPLEPTEMLQLRHPDGARWALPHLVQMIERGSSRVAKRHPGGVLLVGDLSRRGGGNLRGHVSHESGRDADVGFYYVDANSKPVPARRFLAVAADGKVPGSALSFDVARNWSMVESWVTDPRAIVQHIFVADPLREKLLSHARSVRAYGPVVWRASQALKQPSRGKLHDDHFHVRIACPRAQREVCVPEPQPRDRNANDRPGD